MNSPPNEPALQNEPTAVLLIAHGSRRVEANAELVQLAELVRKTNRYPVVEYSFLELAEPTIPAGIRSCLEQQVTRLLLMPWFLSPGVHVTKDLEQYRENFARDNPDVEFHLCQPLGLHPKLIEVVLDRLEESRN